MILELVRRKTNEGVIKESGMDAMQNELVNDECTKLEHVRV